MQTNKFLISINGIQIYFHGTNSFYIWNNIEDSQ